MHNLSATRIDFARKNSARPVFWSALTLSLAACHSADPVVISPDSGGVARDAGSVAHDGGSALDGGSVALDGGSALDAARGAGDAGPSALETAVKGVVADYDEQVRTNCPCFVQMGAYASVEECFMFQGSGPDWVSCATRFLAAYDTPEVHEIFRCYQAQTRAGTACLAMTACDADKRAQCPGASLECFQSNPEVGLKLAMACPDISLLPRL
jgi:hypothetical protein